MKTVARKTILLLGALSFLLVNNSCRKGEDDPAISLRTRKARLTGEWTMKSGSASITYQNYNETAKFNGSGFEIYSTPTGGSPVIYTGKYLLSLNIKKDGTFTVHELNGIYTFDAGGTWLFNSKEGKEKKKEDVIFYINQVTSSSLAKHVFNRASANFTYKIKELRNKKIALSSLGEAPNGYGYINFSTDYTFAQ